MEISTLRGCGSKGRAEVSIKLAWECRVQYSVPYLPFKLRNILFPCGRALLWQQGGQNPPPAASPAVVWELGPGRQVAAAAPPVNFGARRVSEGRVANAQLLEMGQEKGRAWRKSCTSKPAAMFDSMGTIGALALVLAGEVLWIVTGFVHGDRNAVQELLLV